MQMLKLFLALPLFFCLLSPAFAQNEPDCAALEGVWEYDLDTHRGLWFSKDGRYLWVMVGKERSELPDGELGLKEKAHAFSVINIAYGEISCDEKRGTAKNIYAEIPAWTGNAFQFDFEIAEGRARYWVIQENGSRGPGGRTHKIADIPAPGEEGCSRIAGFWAYSLAEQEGIFVASEEYFAWILINKEFWQSNPGLDTEEDKARAFDNISAAAGTYSCDEEGRYEWRRLHAKDSRAEKGTFLSEGYIEDETQHYWILDGEGRRYEPGGKAVRLK